MRRRYTKRQLQPIGDILSAVLKKRGMAARLEENNLARLWPKAVGEKIAAQTQPSGWRDGTLFIRAASSVWVQQLHFMKEEIRRKMNELAGKQAVREIHFTVGYDPAAKNKAHAPAGSQKIALMERDKKMIAECTESLADRELAAIVKRVMKAEISRRRLRGK